MSVLLSGADPRLLPEPVLARFVAAATARGGRVAVVVGAGSDPEPFEGIAARLNSAGPVEVEALPLAPGEPLALPDDPARLGGLVVTDVDAATLLAALGERLAPLARTIRGGLAYLGLGAGSRLAARHAIVSGSLSDGRRIADEASGPGELVLADGLALVGTTIETDTDAHQRLERAVTAVITSPAAYALALDESVTLLVDPVSGSHEALGAGIVQWLHCDGGDVRIRRTRAVPLTPAPTGDAPAAAAGDPAPSPGPTGGPTGVDPSAPASGQATSCP